ncbi:MAG TPA: hypothetical protein VKQ28_05530 [Candidatus Acidoferrum sp.]|nr:hypothetical protein [Candidatus Acidoferrum sp.]
MQFRVGVFDGVSHDYMETRAGDGAWLMFELLARLVENGLLQVPPSNVETSSSV